MKTPWHEKIRMWWYRWVIRHICHHNTNWMLENDRLILTSEPFILTDELRARVEKWIERENAIEQEAQDG